MEFSNIPSSDLFPCSVRNILICFVVEATELSRPRRDFTFGSSGGGARRWERRSSEIECSKVDLYDGNGGEFTR
jgi:hypothetical protein